MRTKKKFKTSSTITFFIQFLNYPFYILKYRLELYSYNKKIWEYNIERESYE